MSTANKLYNHISCKRKFKSVSQDHQNLLSQWADSNLGDCSQEKIVQNVPLLFHDITNLFDEFGVSGLLWNPQAIPVTNGIASSHCELNAEEIEKIEYLIHHSSNLAAIADDTNNFKPLSLGIKMIAIPCGFTSAEMYDYVIHYQANNDCKRKMLRFTTQINHKIMDEYIKVLRTEFKNEIPFRKHDGFLSRDSPRNFNHIYDVEINLKQGYLEHTMTSMDNTATNINQFERWLKKTQEFVNEKCENWKYDLNLFLCDYFRYYHLMFECLQNDKFFISNVLNAWFMNNMCVMNSICHGISISIVNFIWQKMEWHKGTISMLQTQIIPLLPIIWLQKFSNFMEDWANNNTNFSQLQCFELICNYMVKKYINCEWNDYSRGTYLNSSLKTRPNVKPTTCYSSLIAEHYDLFLSCKWIGSGPKIKFLEIVHTFILLAVPNVFTVFIKYFRNLVDGKQYASPTCEQCMDQNDIEIITVAKQMHCSHEISKTAPQSANILKNFNESNLWKHICNDILAPINILLQIQSDFTCIQQLLQKLVNHEIEWNDFEKLMTEMVELKVFHSLLQCYNDTEIWKFIWQKLHMKLPESNNDLSHFISNSKHSLLITNLKSWQFQEQSISKYNEIIQNFVSDESIEIQPFNMRFMIDLLELMHQSNDYIFMQSSMNFMTILPLCNPYSKLSKKFHKGSNSCNIGLGLQRKIDIQSSNLKFVASAIEQCGINLAKYLGFIPENSNENAISLSEKMKNNHKTTAQINQTKLGIYTTRDIFICKSKQDICDFCIDDNKSNIFLFLGIDLLNEIDMVVQSLRGEINDTYLQKLKNIWNEYINLNDERLLSYFEAQLSLHEIDCVGVVLFLPIFVNGNVDELESLVVDSQKLAQICDKLNAYLKIHFTKYVFNHIFFIKDKLINGSHCCLVCIANYHKNEELITNVFKCNTKFWAKWINTWFSQVIQIVGKCGKPSMGLMNHATSVVFDLSLTSISNYQSIYYNVLSWLLMLQQFTFFF